MFHLHLCARVCERACVNARVRGSVCECTTFSCNVYRHTFKHVFHMLVIRVRVSVCVRAPHFRITCRTHSHRLGAALKGTKHDTLRSEAINHTHTLAYTHPREPEMGKKCGSLRFMSSASSWVILSILLNTCRHGIYTRLPAAVAVRIRSRVST